MGSWAEVTLKFGIAILLIFTFSVVFRLNCDLPMEEESGVLRGKPSPNSSLATFASVPNWTAAMVRDGIISGNTLDHSATVGGTADDLQCSRYRGCSRDSTKPLSNSKYCFLPQNEVDLPLS